MSNLKINKERKKKKKNFFLLLFVQIQFIKGARKKEKKKEAQWGGNKYRFTCSV